MGKIINLSRQSDFQPGQVHQVGHFFWIGDYGTKFIGYGPDAQHLHGLSAHGGSVDEHCHVKILRIQGEQAIVELIRPDVPGGAPAAVQTVFSIPLEVIAGWPACIAERMKSRARSTSIIEDIYGRPGKSAEED